MQFISLTRLIQLVIPILYGGLEYGLTLDAFMHMVICGLLRTPPLVWIWFGGHHFHLKCTLALLR